MMRGLYLFLLVISSAVQAQITDFRRADSIANHYKGENLNNLPLLAYNLTYPLTSKVEQFRAIYTWVSMNIENDYDYYIINKQKREKLHYNSPEFAQWNESFKSKVFKKLLKEQKTICTGYAYLVKELADLADIECKIIDGYGRNITANIGGSGIPNHSWNVVKLNDKWYFCDATWSSGHTVLPEKSFVFDYNDGYFLAEPELFAKNHYPLDTTWLLMDNKPTLTEFLNAPIIYKYAFNYQMTPLAPTRKNLQITKNELVSFLFKAPDSIINQDINIELVEGLNTSTAKPAINRTKEGYLELKYKFERLGQYDVHIKVAENHIVTYTIKVKRNKSN